MTDLHNAAENGDLATCRVLIEQGADVNTKDEFEETPLHNAARHGHLDICELLIEHGAVVYAMDYYERTPLYYATEEGNPEICELLIKHNADVNAKDKYSETPLRCAAEEGYLKICELLIQHNTDVNAKDNGGSMPLHYAAWNGYLETCELLIRHGADVNAKDKDGCTPLHYAAWNGDLETCELLIRHGADVHAKNRYSETPLHSATWYGHLEICECLFLKHGATMDKDSLSKYRKYRSSQLHKLFQHFKTERDESLFNILTQSDHTIRSFISTLIHDEVMPIFGQRDQEMDDYACDLLHLYCRYPQIRAYLEHGFDFQKVRWTTDKKYTKQYRLWIQRWQFDNRNPIEVTSLISPTFNPRLTQNIKYCITK